MRRNDDGGVIEELDETRDLRKTKMRKDGLSHFLEAEICGSTADLELQRRGLGHFVGARLVGRGVGLDVVGFHKIVGEEKGFNFVTADVRQHPAVDLDARAEHLAAFLDHFLALQGVVDDVAVFKGQVIFAHDGADALAPAAGGFQVGNDFGFVHNY